MADAFAMSPILKGLNHPAQGCAAEALLWVRRSKIFSNPVRVESSAQSSDPEMQLFQS